MSKHTPGPWRLGESHSGGSADIKEANHHTLVATAISPGNHAQARANARLIAKAPEMYVLLVRISDGDPFYDDPDEGAFCQFCGVTGRRTPHAAGCGWVEALAILAAINGGQP